MATPAAQFTQPGYEVSPDPARLDFAVIHAYISGESYWAKGIPAETLKRAVANSLCFGLYEQASGAQVGFARLVTDCATFAYLADVFVLAAHRGKGLSKLIMQAVMAHPEAQGLRRWMLATADAHSLYTQFGFTAPARPERLMERVFPDIYKNLAGTTP